MSLKIEPIETNKDRLKERIKQECIDGILPYPTTSTIIIGGTGSGKTNLLVNMLSKTELMGDVYDEIYVLSSTGETDDVMKYLKVPEGNLFSNLMEGVKYMENIFEIQKKIIKAVGEGDAPLICLIYDDVLGDRELLKSNFFKSSFIKGRHYNCGVFVLTQHITSIPPICRSQCTNWIYFANNLKNDEILTEIQCPPKYKKKEFYQIISKATEEPYSFLFINRKLPFKTRYRIRFEQIINLDRL